MFYIVAFARVEIKICNDNLYKDVQIGIAHFNFFV